VNATAMTEVRLKNQAQVAVTIGARVSMENKMNAGARARSSEPIAIAASPAGRGRRHQGAQRHVVRHAEVRAAQVERQEEDM
jgi:hypothetical protein